ncbi:MAG: hypothetical protein GY838_05905 [bacterium]|nr:hypothetical protein [bacterium]
MANKYSGMISDSAQRIGPELHHREGDLGQRHDRHHADDLVRGKLPGNRRPSLESVTKPVASAFFGSNLDFGVNSLERDLRRVRHNLHRDAPTYACSGTRVLTSGEWPFRNYRCAPYGAATDCGSKAIVRVEMLEKAVQQWALDLAAGANAVKIAAREIAQAEVKRARQQAKDRRPLEREVRCLQTRVDNLVEGIACGIPRPSRSS